MRVGVRSAGAEHGHSVRRVGRGELLERGKVPNDQLLADLRALVGDSGVVTGEPLRARTYDESAGEVRAQMLVRPRDTAQVSAVLRLCHSRGQTVVTHGGSDRAGLRLRGPA